jgi:large subunit ribosomal protein L10
LALKRERKEELVADYTDLLRESKGVILTEYRGLTNQQITKLRRAIRDANGAYHVTKVTLLRRALEETGYPIPEDLLGGAPIGVGFALDEMSTLAKALKTYAKDTELFSVRGGIMGEQVMTSKQVEAIADLPSIDELRAQILGLIDAPASNLVGVLQAGTAQLVNVIHALVEERGGATAEAAGD